MTVEKTVWYHCYAHEKAIFTDITKNGLSPLLHILEDTPGVLMLIVPAVLRRS